MPQDMPEKARGTAMALYRDAGVLTLGGALLGIFIAAGAVAVYLLLPARPDIQEIRDFGVLVGFEVAALSFAVSSLLRATGRRSKDNGPYAI
jgi:hypothetical protein